MALQKFLQPNVSSFLDKGTEAEPGSSISTFATDLEGETPWSKGEVAWAPMSSLQKLAPPHRQDVTVVLAPGEGAGHVTSDPSSAVVSRVSVFST